MAGKLLIVESPAKAKTIGKYLGPDFTVKASVGHVRDLPQKGLNIKITPCKADGAWKFEPTYEISANKKKVVEELRKAAKAADEIYLAPDPDREGEAIAWHLEEVLASATKGKPVRRVTYNEITKSAVKAAIENPGEVNLARVDAQQARRILDRLVGFKVSPLLWKSLSYGYTLSAGRVQSVALRLVVEREREIQAFQPVAYWVLGVEAAKGASQGAASFIARLSRLDGEKPNIRQLDAATSLVDDLDGAGLVVESVKKTARARHPYPPFTTSTLQQAASSVCGFSPHRTMSIAQKLYEEGLITYMRTDSVNVAEVARRAAAQLVTSEFGAEYLPETPNFYKSKENAQAAHEAIRPTDVARKPGTVGLDASAAKLYDLIWRRFVASQMADAKFLLRTVAIKAVKAGDSLRHDYLFTASSTSVEFDGFLKVMPTALSKKKGEGDGDEDTDEVSSLPRLTEGEKLVVNRILSERKETKPPARYSEAALVKALEENGVGRPSTYAQTIETLVARSYATREGRQLVPTQRGMDVNDWLVKKLEPLFNVGYTANMEAELDKVEDGAEKGDDMLSGFYRQFVAWLEEAKDPPPPDEKFDAVFAMLDEVREWKTPVGKGKRVFDDKGFVDSVRKQRADGRLPLSDKQLATLAKLAIAYRDQISDSEMRIIDLGFGPELDRVKNAPSAELVKWCFQTIDRIGSLTKNPFLASLREQMDAGRQLSLKQFSILARTVGTNAGSLDDADLVRQRLAPYVPGGFETAPSDPAIPELLAMADEIKTWREPLKRGRHEYDDQAFVKSLRDQFGRRRSLSPRQSAALRRVVLCYRDQISDFAARAEKINLSSPEPSEAGDAKPTRRRARSGKAS